MHSPDRIWWWDGERWVPAVSPDRRWWWDGSAWVAVVKAPKPPKPLWWRVLFVVGACLAGVAAAIGPVVGYAYLSGSYHESLWIDDDQVWETSRAGCERINSALFDPAADRTDRISAGNDAIDALLVDLLALGEERLADDEPALDWIEDWRRLAEARRFYGDALAAGSSAAFEVPVARGHPISERMAGVGPEECGEAVRAAANP